MCIRDRSYILVLSPLPRGFRATALGVAGAAADLYVLQPDDEAAFSSSPCFGRVVDGEVVAGATVAAERLQTSCSAAEGCPGGVVTALGRCAAKIRLRVLGASGGG